MKATYFEVFLEYNTGHVEQIFSKDINIEQGTPDWEPEFVDYDRPFSSYYSDRPSIREIRYVNYWGGIVIMQVPSTAIIRYFKYTGDVWWLEVDGKRVSPIMDRVEDIFGEKAKNPTSKVIVKSFAEEEDEDE